MRARDADRNEVVEAIDAAFVDGQLTADEREQRVAEALSAVDLDELRRLVKDLQNAPERFRPGVVASVRAAATATPPRRIGAAAAVIAAVVAVPLTFAAIDDENSSYTPSPTVYEQPNVDAELEHANSFAIMWSTIKDELTSGQPAGQREGTVPALKPWKVKPAKVTKLFEVIHNQFDTPYLRELSLRDAYLSFVRPLKGSQPRTESWNVDQQGNARASEPVVESGRDLAVFDTRDVDVKALFANLKKALTTLNVEDAELSWIDVEIDSSTDVPQITIWVDNKYQESAWLVTSLDGKVMEEHAFSAQ